MKLMHQAEEILLPSNSHPVCLCGARVEEDELEDVGDEPRDVAEHEEHHHQDRRLRVTRVPLLCQCQIFRVLN